MRWIKRGCVFRPQDMYEWMVSHASNPVAEQIGGSVFRVYFSTRDISNRSRVGYVEFDIRTPEHLLAVSSRPVVDVGAAGMFDDSGVSVGCLVRHDGKRYFYYVGWNLGVTVPWRNSIGLATGEGEPPMFRKHSRAPILDRGELDPFSLSYPWVLNEGSKWRMWYGTNLTWGPKPEDMRHAIRYAESLDGIKWEPAERLCIPLRSEEHAVSRPCVIRWGGVYMMWYSVKGQAYRLGYAVSDDGFEWERKDDQVGIDVSPTGWDSEMIEYPSTFAWEGKLYLLYNGNGYGKTGFGLAELGSAV